MIHPDKALLAIVLAGCHSARQLDEADIVQAVQLVLDAEPQVWPDAAAPLLRAEPARPDSIGDALCDAVAQREHASGSQLAIGLVGRLGTESHIDWLEHRLVTDGPHAAEAAMALGQLGERVATQRSSQSLRAVVSDNGRDATVRTAAAVALFDLGVDAAAVPFLHAILIAGTPAGQESGQRLALPDRSRWALERNMVIGAIARRTGGEIFGLDAESPWPRLSAAADRFRAAFATPATDGKPR